MRGESSTHTHTHTPALMIWKVSPASAVCDQLTHCQIITQIYSELSLTVLRDQLLDPDRESADLFRPIPSLVLTYKSIYFILEAPVVNIPSTAVCLFMSWICSCFLDIWRSDEPTAPQREQKDENSDKKMWVSECIVSAEIMKTMQLHRNTDGSIRRHLVMSVFSLVNQQITSLILQMFRRCWHLNPVVV